MAGNKLSNKGYVLIRGQKAPICGRICMDQFMVDVTEIDGVSKGDEVTLLGKDKDLEITMEDLRELVIRYSRELEHSDINQKQMEKLMTRKRLPWLKGKQV